MNKLPIEFHVKKRSELAEKLGSSSIAIIAAANEKIRSNDTEYLFRQDSYFFYLTGFLEPEAVLIIKNGNSILFCPNKDETTEIWTGRRLGAQNAIAAFKVEEAYPLSELETRLPELLNQTQILWQLDGQQPHCDNLINNAIAKLKTTSKQGSKAPTIRRDLHETLDEMRLIKTAEEIEIISQAAEITAQGHIRAMQSCRPNMAEFQLEAEILHEFAKHGARFTSYNSIVGGGENGCILHYTQNGDQLKNGELVLIDAGCEFAGYAGDITRTFPINGKFSAEQKALYQIVLNANLVAIEQIKIGSCFENANNAAVQILVSGLVELGLLQGSVEKLIKEKAYQQFYMHGIGHWLGLDVHDVGSTYYQDQRNKRPFEEGMLLTIEPGLYIASSAKVEAKWHGIGIRIEDNLLVTKNGHKILTATAPKEIAKIEEIMQNSLSNQQHTKGNL